MSSLLYFVMAEIESDGCTNNVTSEDKVDFDEVDIWKPRGLTQKGKQEIEVTSKFLNEVGKNNISINIHESRPENTVHQEDKNMLLSLGKAESNSDIRVITGSMEKSSENNFIVSALRDKKKFAEIEEKFDQLQQKSIEMKKKVTERQMKTEQRRASRLIKKALKDKTIKDIVEKDGVKEDATSKDQAAEEWKGLKPFLTINDHLKGQVSHGSIGPKTEIEHLIDKAISEDDLNKAEILSDHLANRQFSVKIVQAFAAKRYAEKKAKEETSARAKRIKKLSWGFDAKERWEMKGNM
ncbi:uncharacterized protein LOC143250484 isoform X2 [Tachypleus tridentatus]|uniref:uncharacterized protein LOC143250484 isoform X2 n=1 Tax=Tachypleus tridentatus TaxID=6853 RepID=UPI003FD5F0EA